MLSEVLVIVLLVLLNGVLSGAEIAVVAVRKTRLHELQQAGSGAAGAVAALREAPERFFATVQVGITVVGAAAAAFGGATFAHDLEQVLRPLRWVGPYAREVSLAVVVSLVSVLSVVVGELVPKSLALRAPERYALLAGRPLVLLAWLMRPVVWFLVTTSNLVLRLFGDKTSFTEARLSPEELKEMVEEATAAGTVDAHSGEIAFRALGLGSLAVSDVMVPRPHVVALPRGASREQLRTVLLEQTHSRLPVYEGSLDHVVGYITVKDVLSVAWEERLFVLEDLLRIPWAVPGAMKAVDLLTEMQRRHLPFAIVQDERGATAGVVAIEDVLEELVGSMFSEYVHHVPEPYHAQPDGSVVVVGAAEVRELNRALGMELPEDKAWRTVAGLCLALVKHIPVKGERLATANGYVLEVVDASPRRVRAVRVFRPPPRG